MHIDDKRAAIRYEIRQEFDIAEGEAIPEDVWNRFNRLTLLKNAHENRKIMNLTLDEAREQDAEAQSHPDKPHYVIRWLLWHTIKDALQIQDADLNMRKDKIFLQDTPPIIKAIKDNEPAFKMWGYISKKKDYEKYPFEPIKKLLNKRLDLEVVYKGHRAENGTAEDQDKIIDYYTKQKIYQSIFGVGQGGWAHQLKSRESRWKAAKEHINKIVFLEGGSFEKLEKAQQAYYLAYTPHLQICKWKYEWLGINPDRAKTDFLISDYNQALGAAEIKLIQNVAREFK